MPWPLYPRGKSPWYPLDRRLGGLQSQSGFTEPGSGDTSLMIIKGKGCSKIGGSIRSMMCKSEKLFFNT
jgi:hypothetical protein